MKNGGNDGRKPADELYRAYAFLEDAGWIREEVLTSRAEGLQLPILSFRTKRKGRALWVLSGIHGEEPAGPNAIAEAIGDIAPLGDIFAVVLLPLCNPLGYARNWRYLNRQKWEEGGDVRSVGDSEHMLPQLNDPRTPRTSRTSSPEADALTRHVLALARDYPPLVTIDLHEDDLLSEGYVYSQGRFGTEDGIAVEIVRLISQAGIPVKKDGKTRFDEAVIDGIVGAGHDGSIDELLASEKVIVGGEVVKGPHAVTTIVVETPAGAMALEQRKAAHLAVLRNLQALMLLAIPESAT